MNLSKIKSIVGCAVLGLAGLLYLNYSGPEKKVEQEKVEYVKPMSFSQNASGLIQRCIDDMEYAGAKLMYDEKNANSHFHTLLEYADANKDNCIDRDESIELCGYWLNPETAGGRLALPYKGPPLEDNVADGTDIFVEGMKKFPVETRILFMNNRFYVIKTIDGNLDNIISGAEASRALSKMRGGCNECE